MTVLAIGALLIVIGILSISFPQLANSLKANDHQQWELLGSPPPYAFSKTIGVFSWILSHGYEKSASEEVMTLGKKALVKALIAKYSLLMGAVLLAVGFALALLTT